MNLTRIAIARPRFIAVVVIVMMLFGFVGYTNLGMDLFPNVNIPVVTVSTQYPGASPEDVARLVTKPIEDAVAGISDLDVLTSTSAEGRSIVTATFKDKADASTVANEVERRVSAARSLLPTDALSPSVQKVDPAAQPIMFIALYSETGLDAVYRYADERLRPRLESVNGVGSVDIAGGLQREIKVEVNGQRLRAYGLSLDQISQALARDNQGTPGGQIETNARTNDLRLTGLFVDLDDIRQAAIATTAAGTVRVGDVATVTDGFKRVVRITRVNGQPGVLITITKQATANAVEVGATISKVLAETKKALPEGMEIEKVVDSTVYTKNSINGVFITLGEACILTALVLLVFLHTLRSTLIVLLAIPTSLVTTMFAMYVFGFSLNVMSTLGLTLVIGVLVDDSIVVLENIFRHLELGESPKQAALNGRSEIGLAAIAITLVDVVVFTPVAFLQGSVGQYFKQFALVITTSTLLSLFISFTLTPMLASRLLNRDVIRIKGGPWGWFCHQWEAMFTRLEHSYQNTLRWALRHRWVPPVVAIISLVAAIAMVPLGLVKFEFIARTDEGRFSVYLEMPPGTAINATDETMRYLETRLRQVPEIEMVVTSTGRGSPNSLGQFQQGGRFAQTIVTVVDKKHRTRSTDDIVTELRPDLEALAGANAKVRVEAASAGGNAQPISLRITGEERATLQAVARDIENAIRSVPGTRDVLNSESAASPESRFIPDRRRLSDFGLSTAQVASVLRTTVEGTVPTKLRPEEQNEVDIRLIGDVATRTSLAEVTEMPILAPNGQLVSLAQVTRQDEGASAATVIRQNRQRAIVVSAGLEPGVVLGTATQQLTAKLRDITLPPGYRWEYTGTVQSQQEGFRDLTNALLLSLFLIFFVMIALYESITMPLVNMFALPVSLVGAFVGLAIGRESLNILSMIGLIFLMGLVAKNGILLVDYTNTLRKRGLARDQAILQAGPTRLRPIVMTTMALVLGLMPLALKFEEGAELRAGIGWIIIGGMISSTLLSLILIPTMYTLVEDFTNWLAGLFSRDRRAQARRQTVAQPEPAIILAPNFVPGGATIVAESNGHRSNGRHTKKGQAVATHANGSHANGATKPAVEVRAAPERERDLV